MRHILGVCLVLCGAALAAGQRAGDQPDGRPMALPPAGFWPTDRMMDLFINRMTETMAERYGFDDQQLDNTRSMIKGRFPTWLNQNRAAIQSLTNEFFESAMGDNPPTPEQVANWAHRALPLINEGMGLVDQTMEEMRSYLTEEQAARIGRHQAGLSVARQLVLDRLQRWEGGGFDPGEWVRHPDFGPTQVPNIEAARDQIRQAEQAAAALSAMRQQLPQPVQQASGNGPAGEQGGPPPGVKPAEANRPAGGIDVDQWDAYVADFIQKHQLSEEKQNRARADLARAKQDRDRYLARKLNEIRELEPKVLQAQTDEERAAVRDKLNKLTEPVERTFERLKKRLDGLLTTRQRSEKTPAGSRP